MAEVFEVEFAQPAADYRPNGGGNRWRRARLAKKMRQEAYLVALAQLREEPLRWAAFCPRVYDLVWYFWAGPGPDEDNVVASCKALLDGCADALGVNDRKLHLGEVHRVRVQRRSPKAGRLLIRFYEEVGEGA